MLTNAIQIAVVSRDQCLLSGPAQGLQLKGKDRAGLCLRPNRPQPVTGFPFGTFEQHLGSASIMLSHEMILKQTLKAPKPVTRPGTALDGQKDIVLGRRGRCRGSARHRPFSLLIPSPGAVTTH